MKEQARLQLSNGDILAFVKQSFGGRLGRREKRTTRVLDGSGNVIGRMEHVTHTSTEDLFESRHSLIEYARVGNIIMLDEWSYGDYKKNVLRHKKAVFLHNEFP